MKKNPLLVNFAAGAFVAVMVILALVLFSKLEQQNKALEGPVQTNSAERP